MNIEQGIRNSEVKTSTFFTFRIPYSLFNIHYFIPQKRLLNLATICRGAGINLYDLADIHKQRNLDHCAGL